MFAMHHKERMAAIEKGMEVPPLPAEFFRDNRRVRVPSDYLRRGLVLLLVGIAITIALFDSTRRNYLWGLLPTAMGIANLLYYWFESRKTTSEQDHTKSTGA
jgi:hypothetical protein